MFKDDDIKIAGDRPSKDIELNKLRQDSILGLDKELISSAKKAGSEVAKLFLDSLKNSEDGEEKDFELIIERRLLLLFTATVGFEQHIQSDSLSGIAQKSFLDTLKKSSPEIYETACDTGAFSFYYLAYRRGGDIERRMGQTFAMLCSHDGDPIFQELGEALYCWFYSAVEKTINKQFNK